METTIKVNELKNIKIILENNQYTAVLVDDEGFDIIRGFGSTPTEAINDLHINLI